MVTGCGLSLPILLHADSNRHLLPGFLDPERDEHGVSRDLPGVLLSGGQFHHQQADQERQGTDHPLNILQEILVSNRVVLLTLHYRQVHLLPVLP